MAKNDCGANWADFHALLYQAPETAGGYLRKAIERIDKNFKDGYAKKHPELIGAFMNACAVDYNTSLTIAVLQDVVEALGRLDYSD